MAKSTRGDADPSVSGIAYCPAVAESRWSRFLVRWTCSRRRRVRVTSSAGHRPPRESARSRWHRPAAAKPRRPCRRRGARSRHPVRPQPDTTRSILHPTRPPPDASGNQRVERAARACRLRVGEGRPSALPSQSRAERRDTGEKDEARPRRPEAGQGIRCREEYDTQCQRRRRLDTPARARAPRQAKEQQCADYGAEHRRRVGGEVLKGRGASAKAERIRGLEEQRAEECLCGPAGAAATSARRPAPAEA